MTTRKVALAFLAHPDDAEFLCAGTLIRLADLDWEIHIATATAGDAGTNVHNRWDIASIRTTEARKAAAMINATYHCLGENDGMVVYDRTSVQKAIDLFRRVAPSLVFTHAPKDYMMDHEMVSLLARCASFVHGAPNISLFPLIPGSGIPHFYYCDPIEGNDPLGNPVTPTTIIDISKQEPRKLEMLACHASQREWLRSHHGMDEYLDAAKRHDAMRGAMINTPAAEAFIQHRGHPYPKTDLLKSLFP